MSGEAIELLRGDVSAFLLRLDATPDQTLRITAFTGREGISELFHYHVECCSPDPDIHLESMLSWGCTLEVETQHGPRHVNGIVQRFDRLGVREGIAYYAAEIVPSHWYLTRRINTRIFQEPNCPDMSVPGILEKVLRDAGFLDDQFEFRLADPSVYAPREYVVQYRESDMNFIARLVEQEGIFYFFEHTPDGHVMVFGDSAAAHKDLGSPRNGGNGQLTGAAAPERLHSGSTDPATIDYVEPGDLGDRECVFGVRTLRSIQLGRVTVTDYDFTRPDMLLLRPPADAPRFTDLELYEHPGGSVDAEVLDRYAQIRLQAEQCQDRVFELSATARHLVPGYRFRLTGYPHAGREGLNEDPNREYLVTRVVHQAVQSQSAEEFQERSEGTRYEATVWAIPFEVPFRPPRVTRRPTVPGSQTAVVVPQEGSPDEIYVDRYGRVKVQFHWDREQPAADSSMFIRVNQGWAGHGWGMLFLPRVGQEVIVDFLEGDPDRPIITGRVYNGENMPPVPLPAERTRSVIRSSTPGDPARFHMIRFEDRPHEEQLLIRAQTRMDTCVRGPHFHSVAGSLHESVGHTADGGNRGQYFRTVKEGVHLHNEGKQFVEIQDLRHTSVGQQVIDEYQQSYLLMVTDLIEANAREAVLQMRDRLVLMVDEQNYIVIHKDGVDIVGNTVKINCQSQNPGAVREMDILPPLDAAGADCGQGRRRGGGGGGGRARRREQVPRRLVPQRTAPHPRPRRPDPPPPPPSVDPTLECALLSILARCVHGARQAVENQTLEVVPSRGSNRDHVELVAEIQNPCAEHPLWHVSDHNPLRGARQSFEATMPEVSGLWIPRAQPRRYSVRCEAHHQAPRRLQVHAYPNNELNFSSDQPGALGRVLGLVWGRIRQLLETFGSTAGLEVTLLDGNLGIQSRWREFTDHRAYYWYDIQLHFTPLIGVSGSISVLDLIPIGRLLRAGRRIVQRLGRMLERVARWIRAAGGLELSLSGEIDLNARFQRNSPDEPLFAAPAVNGLTGRIPVALTLDVGVPPPPSAFQIISVSVAATGGIEATGDPFVDATGVGLRGFKVDFTGIEGTLDVEFLGGVLTDPIHESTTFVERQTLWGPETVYLYRDE